MVGKDRFLLAIELRVCEGSLVEGSFKVGRDEDVLLGLASEAHE